MVDVTGVQRCNQANKRPQQARTAVTRFYFVDHTSTRTTDTRSQAYIVSAGRKENKQTVQSIRSSKQPNQQNLCFLGTSSTTNFSTTTQPIKSDKVSNQSLVNHLLNYVTELTNLEKKL